MLVVPFVTCIVSIATILLVTSLDIRSNICHHRPVSFFVAYMALVASRVCDTAKMVSLERDSCESFAILKG